MRQINILATAIFAAGACFLCLASHVSAAPPQATIGSGFHNASNGFFENNGVNFGFNIPAPLPTNGQSAVVGLNPFGGVNPGGINFGQGGAGGVAPGVGGFNPADANTFGFTINSGLGAFNFGITASQGSDSFVGSQSASVTVMDGGTGFISDASLRPFVTSVTPVVGGFAGASQPQFMIPGPAPAVAPFGSSALGERLHRLGEKPGPREKSPAGSAIQVEDAVAEVPQDSFARELATARQSTAGQPAAGVAEIRAQQAAVDEAANAELRGILAQAEEAMNLGKPNVAKIYYQQLARRATGSLKQQALDALKDIEAKK
jgi:hypothetical protein